ncbi:MAG: SGNH/GDSL hydrolase family protein, partial [Eubacterium sp.]|nr:SGNH/GDSL hydrolase family protein [Eubacterium sp.]
KSFIESIKKICEENGAELMLVSVPCDKNWNCERHNPAAELSEKLGIEFMDMNYMQDEIPIDWSCDSRDGGEHLNQSGAEKVTSYFGAYLNAKNIFTDHRNDKSFEDWNKAYKSFLKEVEKVKTKDKLNDDKKQKKTKS